MPLDRTIGNYFDSSSSFLRRVAQWKGPNPYVTGGEPITAATFGLGRIIVINGSVAVDAAGAIRLAVYNPTTSKIAWYVDGAAGFVEVAGGVNLSTFSGGIEVIGT
jgi:hypothetical protein